MKRLLCMAVVIAMTLGLSGIGAFAYSGAFWDVSADDYYAEAVDWASEREIAGGVGDGRFAPDDVCTRAQVITFLWKACGSPEPAAENPFYDVSPAAYYRQAAAWARETGLVSGSAFGGGQPCTRRDAVTYLWRLAGKPASNVQLPDGVQSWNLRLVNPWNYMPQGFQVSLTQLGGGQSVDSRCAGELKAMLADCRAAGFSPVVCSSYRTQQKQESLFNSRVQKRIAKGMSRAAAEADAAKSTAIPGTSEHQIGLAVDIVDNHDWSLDKSQESMPTQKWLMQHCWEYGFILRYPNNKSSVTGIIYEPWHYRYVGKVASLEMRDRGLCLEEYLQARREDEKAIAWAVEQGITANAGYAAFLPNTTCTRSHVITFLYRALASEQ